MLLRAIPIWLLILVLAVLNGGVREKLVRPRLGEYAGHVLSTVLLCGAILLVTWLTIPWMRPGSERGALALGGFWVLLTLAFEFLAGHYLFGSSWQKLLGDYDILRGRIWVLVLLVTLLAPWWTQHVRGQPAHGRTWSTPQESS